MQQQPQPQQMPYHAQYGAQPQQVQQSQMQQQPQPQQMPYPAQYGVQPNAQPYGNLPPLPGRPQNMPQSQPTEQQVQQFAQGNNDPLPF